MNAANVRPLVLASTSRYRRAVLDAAGFTYEAMAPTFVEDHAAGPKDPSARAIAFARGKAESLASVRPDAWIIGSDQVAEIDGEALEKPGTVERAIEQLTRLSGRTHYLRTAVAICDAQAGRTLHRLVTHEMTMRALTREQIERYVDADSPLDCAGAYKIEARGVRLFETMRGEDHTAIIGIAVSAVVGVLAEMGAGELS